MQPRSFLHRILDKKLMNKLLKKALKAAVIGGGACLAGQALLRRARLFSIRHKMVLVTGGSRGLGLALARQLVDAGAWIVISARTESQLRIAEEELRGRGGDAMAISCDVRDPELVRAMVQQVVDRWGAIDVLFNVAGVMEVGPLDAMTLEDFHNSMNTHCWGSVLAVLPAMRRQGWGRIVNVASLGGKRAVPNMIPYAASKFALVGLSNGLRTELARENILVTTICPGLMRTGSPRNARFKVQHRKEYAWFSISDSLPMVSMNVRKAAEKILVACRRGNGEVVITGPGNPAVWLQRMAPNVMSEFLAAVNNILPAMGGIGRRAAKGYDVSGGQFRATLAVRLDQWPLCVNGGQRA
jgi:NAD(P)-dependent dehydrogenase (short-subunit alcohol dehydrogenase family)